MATIDLTIDDDGRTVSVPLGGIVTIRLAENPGTGYVWGVQRMDEDLLELQQDEYEQVTGGGFGAGGVHLWQFQARQPGMATIQLRMRREWEGDSGETERYEVTLEVF